ncbi:MAG TPA: metal-dependent transcriptional regulator [Actinomycetota bacterium]|jgi:DtxR family transcriptional regulator, Mn-dependent transcriptional regulator|nr:metal-dependent transcriptional regulator [Actinomycetota bacterium]
MPPLDVRDLNPATKEYLEAIYELEEEGRRVLQARISERLGLAAATVSEGVRRLVEEGLCTIEAGREITLTEPGRELAATLVRRHRLAERMLTDILGIPWHLCHEQAEDWEKVMTTEVERAIVDRLDGDLVCPHGNPIPGEPSPVAWTDLRAVADLGPGEGGRLTRLLEDIELDHDVLVYLERHNLMPGRDLTLVEVAPDGTRTLEVDGRRVGLGAQLADNLWVLPA